MKTRKSKEKTGLQIAAEIFTKAEMGPLPDEYQGKLLIINPKCLAEHYRTKNFLVWKADGGFGCSSFLRGRAVFCTCQGDKESARWDRHDFVAEYIPQEVPS